MWSHRWDALIKLPPPLDLRPRKRFDYNRARAPNLGRHRYIAVSDGKMRSVDMNSNNRDNNDMLNVSVWTLQADQDTTSFSTE
jgi:hypothetical protein